MAYFYIDSEGITIGPMEGKGIVAHIRDGKIKYDSLIRKGESGRWKKAGQIEKLARYFDDYLLSSSEPDLQNVQKIESPPPRVPQRSNAEKEIIFTPMISLAFFILFPIGFFFAFIYCQHHWDITFFRAERPLLLLLKPSSVSIGIGLFVGLCPALYRRHLLRQREREEEEKEYEEMMANLTPGELEELHEAQRDEQYRRLENLSLLAQSVARLSGDEETASRLLTQMQLNQLNHNLRKRR